MYIFTKYSFFSLKEKKTGMTSVDNDPLQTVWINQMINPLMYNVPK